MVLYSILSIFYSILSSSSILPFTPYSPAPLYSIISTFYSILCMLYPVNLLLHTFYAPSFWMFCSMLCMLHPFNLLFHTLCSILSTFYSILCSILSTFYSIPYVPFSQPFTPYSQAPRYSILLPYKLTCIVKYNFKLINLSATLMLKSYSSDHQETSLIIYLPYSLGTLIPTRMFYLPMVKEVCILLFYNPHFWPQKINVYK